VVGADEAVEASSATLGATMGGGASCSAAAPWSSVCRWSGCACAPRPCSTASSRDTVGTVEAVGNDAAGALTTGRVENSRWSGAMVSDDELTGAAAGSRMRGPGGGSTRPAISGASTTVGDAGAESGPGIAAPSVESDSHILGANARCTTAASDERRDSTGRAATGSSGPADTVCGVTGLASPNTWPLGPAGSTW
jgi:hypothetical protein